MKKRVLLMRGYYYPETAASNQMCKELVEIMSSSGFEITLLCPVPTRGVTKDIRKRYIKNRIERVSPNLVIKRYWLPSEKSHTLLRFFRYMLQNMYQIIYGLFHAYDILFLYSTPPTNGLVGALLRKIKRIKFFYYLHDVFPDSLVQSHITSKGSALWKIGRKIESITYDKADYIGVISEGIRSNIINKGVDIEKIHLIYNWIDLNMFSKVPRDKNSLFDQYSIDKNSFIVTYAGNIGEAQSVETLVDAARLLRNINNLIFVIIGSGSSLDSCMDKAKGLDNVRFIPMQPPTLVSEVYSLGDVSTVLCKKGIGLTGMPSKVGSIFATSTLLLASFDLDSELAHILNDNNTGVCVEPENPELLAEKIEDICHNVNKYKDCIDNANSFVRNNMDVSICINKIINILS